MKYDSFVANWKAKTEEEKLNYAFYLQQRIKKLEDAAITASWMQNPDRMGGAYTEKEIADASAWR